MTDNVVWKEVAGYEGMYEVSNLGGVKSLSRKIIKSNSAVLISKNRILKPTLSKRGYLVVTLVKKESKKQFTVHRLVASSFLDNTKNNPQVNHIDGVKTNNNMINLEWCTAKENTKHAIKMGLIKPTNPNKNGKMSKEKHSMSKLDCKKVEFIRKNAKKNGGTLRSVDLAKMFEISEANICNIIKNKIWKD